ncbi:hypothetical protein B0H14DRAFT_2654832 [Mycena olivaceomarginata]|nr:hypothetical protein B0H14DRAFT_2654832 [Mycena olivaceomarginata]
MAPAGNPPGRPSGTKAQRAQRAKKMREEAYENARTEIHVANESYDEAVRRHGVKLKSLWHRDHGRQSRHDGHESQKKLLTPEELELVKLLKELDSLGIHFDRRSQ